MTGGLFGEDEYQSWFTVHKAREWLHGGCLPWTEPHLQKTKLYMVILGPWSRFVCTQFGS